MQAKDFNYIHEQIRYTKLVVPLAMRSTYWKYFGFPSSDGVKILTKEKVICSLCSTILAYNKNTTNLKSHLRARHREILLDENSKKIKSHKEKIKIKQSPKSEIEEEEEDMIQMHDIEPGEIIEALKDNYILEEDYGIEIAEEDEEDDIDQSMVMDEVPNYEITEIEVDPISVSFQPADIIKSNDFFETAIANMIITDLLSTDLILGNGFQQFIKTVCQFGKTTIYDIDTKILKMFENQRKSIKKMLNNKLKNRYFSLSFEKWINIENNSFITISVNYIETETKLEMERIAVVPKMEMKNCIIDVLNFDKNIDWENYFDKITNLKLEMCTAAIRNFTDDNLNVFLQNKDIPTIPCFLDIIQRCIEKCFALEYVQGIFEKIFESTDIFDKLSTFERKFWLTKWKILIDYNNSYSNQTDNIYNEIDENIKLIVNYLSPLKMTFDLLGMEKVANSSLIKPLVTQLIDNHYSTDFDGSETELEIKTIIKNELNIQNVTFLNVSSFLDPRFKNFIKDEEIEEARLIIKQKININTNNTNDKTIIKRLEPSKNNTKMGLDFFFSKDIKPKTSYRDKLDKEVSKYMEEEPSSLDQCPIIWWSEFGYLYPNLIKMANIYNNVPACNVHSLLKMSIDEQMDFYKKRFSLYQNVEKLLFLHSNEKFNIN